MNAEPFPVRPSLAPPELYMDVHDRWMNAMYRGDFAEAWRQTDRVESLRRYLERNGEFVWHPNHLLWNGSPFDGRHVLIRCNHGLGDTLQFLRFVPAVSLVAQSVTLMAQPPLVRLLRDHPGFGMVLDGWNEVPPMADFLEVEIMELAYALRVTAESVSRLCPYLSYDHVHSLAQPLPIGVNGGFQRVGLLWAASDWDPNRSVPLKTLAPLFDTPGFEFYSLQQGAAAADIASAGFPLIPLNTHTTDIVDAAAALLRLDLLITVDSMAAHLAGALGRPVWLMLRQNPDWRWMRGRDDSPWYPSMRLFRQKESGWSAVVHQVHRALELCRGSSSAHSADLNRSTVQDLAF